MRIVYGYPGLDLMQAAQRGEVALGGCVISDHDPAHKCRKCGRRFYSDGSEAPPEEDW